jgi:hypothetical protein
MDEENVVYIFIMENYSAIKNKIMSFAGKGIELEIIVVSEINQIQKDKHHMFSLICGI